VTDQDEAPEADDAGTRRRGRPRQGRPIARHLPRNEEILKLAAEVFYTRGYGGTRLDDIAREAGVVKGSLYHYFESKEDIFEQLIVEIVNMVDQDAGRKQRGSPLELLSDMIYRRVLLVAEHPIEVGLIGRQLVHMDGEIGDWARAFRRRNNEALMKLIVAGQKDGSLPPADAESLAAFILGSITVLSEWYRPGGRVSPTELAHSATAFIMSGVGATGWSDPS
jgi:AcrR family transcriptional regulator